MTCKYLSLLEGGRGGGGVLLNERIWIQGKHIIQLKSSPLWEGIYIWGKKILFFLWKGKQNIRILFLEIYPSPLRELNTLSRFSAIYDNGDNFCDFLFAFLHT